MNSKVKNLILPKRKEYECDKNIPIPIRSSPRDRNYFYDKKSWYEYYEEEIKTAFNVFCNISDSHGMFVISNNETFNVFIDYLYDNSSRFKMNKYFD